MRRLSGHDRSFFEGFALALGLVAVTFGTVGAVRRGRMRWGRRRHMDQNVRIDGVIPTPQPVLDVLPQHQLSSAETSRLASEAVDAPVLSQRW